MVDLGILLKENILILPVFVLDVVAEKKIRYFSKTYSVLTVS